MRVAFTGVLKPRSLKRQTEDEEALVGVAMIHQCHTSRPRLLKFKTMLDEFYADSPERLNAAQFGLTLTVKKPASDAEQD